MVHASRPRLRASIRGRCRQVPRDFASPERYKFQVTISQETHDRLRRLQDLLRHAIPNGDPAEILDRALTALLSEVERRRLGATERPRAGRGRRAHSRHIPAAVRRAVWKRDRGRCAFVGRNGRCSETAFLELHHVQPYALGGAPAVENMELRCRAHNQYEAKLVFEDAGAVRESRAAGPGSPW